MGEFACALAAPPQDPHTGLLTRWGTHPSHILTGHHRPTGRRLCPLRLDPQPVRHAITALTVAVLLAACSPYDQPAGAQPATCDRVCWEEVKQRQQAERAWWAEVVAQQRRARDWQRLLAWLAANPPYRPGQCGGTLPPCWVMMRESRGNPRIWNGGCYAPTGWRGKSPCGTSSASGKWQAIRSSWGGYGGYVNAADAPESIQDAWARKLYAGGRGGSHWGL